MSIRSVLVLLALGLLLLNIAQWAINSELVWRLAIINSEVLHARSEGPDNLPGIPMNELVDD